MINRFYPALGTPLDSMGNVVFNSLNKHVEDQVNKKAAGLLVMGSMGIQPVIKNSEYVKVAQIVVEAAHGSCPVYVGVMDNSIARVKDRLNSLNDLQLDGVVATLPYYFQSTQEEMKTFYRSIADASSFPLYLYDLPGVTQCKIQAATVISLMSHPNIAGIKTGDIVLARVLSRKQPEVNPDFQIIYSGLDSFDIACTYGISRNLDGMFSCTSDTTVTMYAALNEGNNKLAADCLDKIVGLRDVFVEVGVFPGFTHAMNLLGFEGNFHPDYASELNLHQAEKVKAFMQHMKLI
jgi:dihydrodipicolinate synthase/N-acetylneuraminate lyase